MLAPDRLRSDDPAIVILFGPCHTDVTRAPACSQGLRSVTCPTGTPGITPEIPGTSRN